VEERTREINRLQKELEGANIKLSSVMSSINGKTSRKILDGIIAGKTDEESIREMVDQKVLHKVPEIMEAIDGVVSSVQKKLLKAIISHIDDMTQRIKEMDDIIDGEMHRYDEAIKELEKVPGIGKQSAKTILAEIGLDMRRFMTAAHLASWAGLCPGNNESAGKRKSGRTNKGNSTLKVTLVQCARAAVNKKDTFFRAQYERLTVRRGANRAVVAVAHSMLIAIYHILKDGVPYKDLGADYYHQFNKDQKIQACLNKLNALGWQPTVTAVG
jgi:transposase